jgi:very-short-patch-repair endonuclease
MQNQATPTARENARALRTGMTDSERKLWDALRRDQLGVKFRRQHPLGNYIADFACLSPKLIIELDGSQHANDVAYESKRDDSLKERGFRVVRFSSRDPLVNMEGVLIRIVKELEMLAGVAPTPALPQRGRGKDRDIP